MSRLPVHIVDSRKHPQVPWTPSGIVTGIFSAECPLWRSYIAEKILNHGADGVTLIVRERGVANAIRLVAKFSVFHKPTAGPVAALEPKTTASQLAPLELDSQYRANTIHAVKVMDPWQLPVINTKPPLLELHNWLAVMQALKPNSEAAPRDTNATNITRIYDWVRCKWTFRDAIRLFQDSESIEKPFPKKLLLFPSASEPSRKLIHDMLKIRDRTLDTVTLNMMETAEIDVQICLVDYNRGETLAIDRLVNSETRPQSSPYPYDSTKNFFDMWTQVGCTLSFLEKRAHLSHGDLHNNNIMTVSAKDAFSDKPPNKTLLLVYDIPIRDQLGVIHRWKYYVHNPAKIVRIIDFGRSRTRLDFEEDNQRMGGAEIVTWASDWADYYIERGDMFSFAMIAFEDIARILQYVEKIDFDTIYQIGRLLLHALERVPYTNKRRPLAVGISKIWGMTALKTNSRLLGEKLEKKLKKRNRNSYKCFQHDETLSEKIREKEFPMNPQLITPPPDDPGRWTVDEHLVTFAPELNGFSVANEEEPCARTPPKWFSDYKRSPDSFYVVEMLPKDSERPLAFFRENLKDIAKISYPLFRGQELSGARGREADDPRAKGLDDPLRLYRTEFGAIASMITK